MFIESGWLRPKHIGALLKARGQLSKEWQPASASARLIPRSHNLCHEPTLQDTSLSCSQPRLSLLSLTAPSCPRPAV